MMACTTKSFALALGMAWAGSAVATKKCPQWAHDAVKDKDADTYTYNSADWAGEPSVHTDWGTGFHNPENGSLAGNGKDDASRTAMCAWVAACKQAATDLDTCLGRTPVANAVMYGESKWSPIAQAFDGDGRGIIQFDYYNPVDGAGGCGDSSWGTCCPKAGPSTTCCTKCPCLMPPGVTTVPFAPGAYPVVDASKINEWFKVCPALHPVRELKQAVINSHDGMSFGGGATTPWWACGSNWANNKDKAGQTYQTMAGEVIAELLDGKTVEFIKPDVCDGSGATNRCGTSWQVHCSDPYPCSATDAPCVKYGMKCYKPVDGPCKAPLSTGAANHSRRLAVVHV